jgi:D-alanyl-D-alanine carboxypeptidase
MAVAAVAAKPEPAAEPAGAHPGVSSALPAPVAAAAPVVPTPKPAPAAKTAAATSTTAKPAPAAPAAKPQHRPGWMIQVGAFPAEQAAQQRLSAVQGKASKMLGGAEAFTETVDKGGTTYYRARFAGLEKDKAEAACKYLKKNDVECVTIKN